MNMSNVIETDPWASPSRTGLSVYILPTDGNS